MRKTITVVLIAAVSALPLSYALAAPQHAGGHEPHMPSMNHDSHGDAVSAGAHSKTLDSDDKNHGQAVSEVANDKNKGHHSGDTKGHHGHHHHHH